jgi:hypothetical protein
MVTNFENTILKTETYGIIQEAPLVVDWFKSILWSMESTSSVVGFGRGFAVCNSQGDNCKLIWECYFLSVTAGEATVSSFIDNCEHLWLT